MSQSITRRRPPNATWTPGRALAEIQPLIHRAALAKMLSVSKSLQRCK